MNSRFFTFLLFWIIQSFSASGQVTLSGTVKDATTHESLSYVNIGIRSKGIGTTSKTDGSWLITIPPSHLIDTLTFSMVGYEEYHMPVNRLQDQQGSTVSLKQKKIQLPGVNISTTKLSEKKIGITKYNPAIHFTDGSVNQNDIFEIAQLMKVGKRKVKVKSVNLYINETQKDSVTCRINFYGFDGKRPGDRIVEKNILQTHAVKEGWLTFNIDSLGVYLTGDFIAAIEFLPHERKQPVQYEIKLGGSSKSFVRNNSLGEWRVPPHHYRLYVTVLTNDEKTNETNVEEEKETRPDFTLFSKSVEDTFSLFVSLPRGYDKNPHKRYPVVFLLDANVYFDQINNSIKSLTGENKIQEVILAGIGYRDFITMDSLRNRDYTFPEAAPGDSFSISGGAIRFLSFIEKELIPYIDSSYRTQTDNRTFMGHSLGGYMVLFALKNDLAGKSPVFRNYVSASPSLDYGRDYMLKEFHNLAVSNDQLKRSLYLTSEFPGETSGNDDSTGNKFDLLIKMLSDKKYHDLEVQSRKYPGYDHMEVAIPSFETGIKLFLENK